MFSNSGNWLQQTSGEIRREPVSGAAPTARLPLNGGVTEQHESAR
jgi:hypothetical protein